MEMKMKKTLVLALGLALFFSCKKKKEETTDPEPEPVKYGTVNFTVLNYDSLGQLQADASGFNVKLNQTSLNATTGADGKVSFSNVQYGSLIPVVTKPDYEGVPVSYELNSPSFSASIPCAKRSTFKIINFAGYHVNKDSIAISFDLSQAPPAGKPVKIAIITGLSGLTPGNYEVLDTFRLGTQNYAKYNLFNFPNFKNYVLQLDSGKTFYVGAVSMSYGLYNSNLFSKPVLIGEHLFSPDNLVFTKNWK
jgi:hypothetical protein